MTNKSNTEFVRKVRAKKSRTAAPKKTSRHQQKQVKTETKPTEDNFVGFVFVGNTMYIDSEPKLHRRYLVTKQKGDNVTVSKLKSIKKFDEAGKNADPFLVEINQNYPGLTKRTGVDKTYYTKNIVKKQSLRIIDKDVFKQMPEFKVSGRDLRKAQVHTGIKKYNKQ